MAYRTTPVRTEKVRASSLILRSVLALTLGVAITAATAPHTGGFFAFDGEAVAATPSPSLRFENAEPVITGSVAGLFDTAIFSGPNRAQKVDRVTVEPDIVAFAQSFDAIRLTIAEQRAAADPLLDRQSGIMVAEGEAEGDMGPRMSVAAIDSGLINSEGLRAIDALSGGADFDPSIPRPVSVPDTLAYARATTPATDFTPKHTWSEREQWCLATGIYFEARGESYRGQVAVAQVIMNRVAHQNYPNTICGVVYQNQHRRNACQFSFACDGKTNVNRTTEVAAWSLAQEITQTVLNQEIYLPEVADATHYHATYVRPHWARNMTRLTQIGLHVFYRFRPGWQFG